METTINEIEVNGKKYVAKDSLTKEMAKSSDGLPYCIIRADRAGVFAGYVVEEKFGDNGQYANVVLRQARRIWFWSGAASISQLAIDGVSKPDSCKFPQAFDADVRILGVIEILPATEKAKKSIEGVKVWQE